MRILFRFVLVSVIVAIVFLEGCTHKKTDPIPVVLSITSFSPTAAMTGNSVTITGVKFSTTASDNTVNFNGTPAVVTSATATQIVVTVPAGAETGTITVDAGGAHAESTSLFTVLYTPELTSFDPSTGIAGTTFLILGDHFSSTASLNTVTINGMAAEVNAATSDQLTVTVPTGATTGKIAITVAGLTVTSTTDFTVYQAPTIGIVDPNYYQTGMLLPNITIPGTNFSTVTTDNLVQFNGVAGTVTAATPTQLTVTPPSNVTTGKISVTVHELTATTLVDFLVGCPDATISDISISDLNGNSYTVTYSIKNVGTIPLDINKMFLQAYQGTAPTLAGGNYQGTVGAGDYGGTGNTETLLVPNEMRQKVQTINAGVSVSTYPYAILTLVSDTGGAVECSTTNNEKSAKIQ